MHERTDTDTARTPDAGAGGAAPARDERPGRDRGRMPAVPRRIRDLDRRSLWATLKRTVSEFQEDELTDRAAALTYYAVLSLFPALLVLVSLLGLLGNAEATTSTLTDIVLELGPASAADALTGPVESITSNRGAAGVLFAVGLVAALFSASGYIGAFMRASNKIYEIDEGRPFWKRRPLQMAIALLMVILVALTLLALVLTGPLVDAVAGPLGIGDAAVTAFTYAKWPVLLVVVLAMLALLYYVSPNVSAAGLSLDHPGQSVLALRGVGRGLGGLCLLRRELRLLRQDLRHARRCDQLPGVGVDHQRRGAARRRAQRGARARPRASCGHPGRRARDPARPARAARRTQDQVRS